MQSYSKDDYCNRLCNAYEKSVFKPLDAKIVRNSLSMYTSLVGVPPGALTRLFSFPKTIRYKRN